MPLLDEFTRRGLLLLGAPLDATLHVETRTERGGYCHTCAYEFTVIELTASTGQSRTFESDDYYGEDLMLAVFRELDAVEPTKS